MRMEFYPERCHFLENPRHLQHPSPFKTGLIAHYSEKNVKNPLKNKQNSHL